MSRLGLPSESDYWLAVGSKYFVGKMKTQTIWLSMNTFTLILDGTVHHNLIIRWLRFARQPTLRSSTSTRGTSWASPTPPWTASGGSNSTAPPNKVQLLDFSIWFWQGFCLKLSVFCFLSIFDGQWRDQAWEYRLTIYRYANIVWFSKYRWNIVIAFFWPYHTIFLGHFLPIFTYFYL